MPTNGYDGGDDNTLLEEMRRMAEQGDTNAQYYMGYRYYHANGGPRDDQEATRWFRLAAEQGHPEAQYYLGLLYAKGIGVPKEYEEAVEWFRLAANQGIGAAQYALQNYLQRIKDRNPYQTEAEEVKNLLKQKDQLRKSIEAILGHAPTESTNEGRLLLGELDRLTERMTGMVDQILFDEMDHILIDNTGKFAQNYVQTPGK